MLFIMHVVDQKQAMLHHIEAPISKMQFLPSKNAKMFKLENAFSRNKFLVGTSKQKITIYLTNENSIVIGIIAEYWCASKYMQ